MSRRVVPALGVRRRPVAASWRLAPLGEPERAADVAMPCQWQTVPAFAHEDGPFVYAADFHAPSWRRVHLVAEGTFARTEWRLNGESVGVHGGAWHEARYDLTDRLRCGLNRLEAVVACPPETARVRTQVTGVFGGWDCLPPDFRPGGMWRPVYLEAAGEVRIRALWLRTDRLDAHRAEVVVHARVEAVRATRCAVALQLVPPPGSDAPPARARLGVDLPAGRSDLELPLVLRRPAVWQPWCRSGEDEAALYALSLRIRPLDRPGPAARRSARVGVRTVGRDRGGRLLVNGRSMFVKGWNYGPSAAHLASASATRIEADVRAARERGLDALRVHAHVDHPALYRAADRLGVLLFQDGPLQWAYRPAAFPDAAVALRALVDRLSGHPSVVELRAHNEPLDAGLSGAEAGREPLGRRLATLWATFAWSENREVWDPALVAALPRTGAGSLANGVMLVAPHSGVIARRAGEDTHMYAGWYPPFGALSRLDTLLALFPRGAAWVTEFGAQSLPVRQTARTFMPERPLAVDWQHLARSRLAQPLLLERAVGIEGLTLDRLIERTQAYQAALHGAYIDRLRVRRSASVCGFFGFFWADAADGISWSLLDRERRPKQAYAALAEQLRPLTAIASLPLEPTAADGRRGPLNVPIWLVNDTGWETRVRVSAGLGDTDALCRTLTLGPESAVRVGELAIGRGRLLAPGALDLAWEAEALGGSGVRPTSGARRYEFPSPLWRRWPGPARPALGPAAAGPGPRAANEP